MDEHNGIEEYQGCRINWEISEIDGSGLWKGTAAVVLPPEALGRSLPHVIAVPGIPDQFGSENEARAMLLKLSREFIDNGMKVY